MTQEQPTPKDTLLARVVSKSKLDSSFIRITLGGPEIDLITPGCEGGHLKLLFPKSGKRDEQSIEELRDQWRPNCFARTYTLFNHRPESQEIDIDIALHPGESGPGGEWVQSAAAGDPILMTIPKGKKLRRTDAAFYVFTCDSCSLPAVRAAVRDLPDSAKGIVIIHSDDAQDQQSIANSHTGMGVHHIQRDLTLPPPVIAATHLNLLRTLTIPTTDTECFVVGESRVVRELKNYLRDDLLIDTDGMYFSAYWKHNHDQDQHKQSKKAEQQQDAPMIEVPKPRQSNPIPS